MVRQQGPTTPRKETQDRIGEPAPAHTCHFVFALSVGLPKKPSHSNTKNLKTMNVMNICKWSLHKCEFGFASIS